jgi:hypothetical protein
MEWLQEQQTASIQRTRGSDEKLVYTSVSMLMFESPAKTRP